jgi:hypothetical protein
MRPAPAQARPLGALALAASLVAGCPSETPDPDQPHAAGFLPTADRELPTGGAGPCAVDIGHIDNDGLLDLAVSHLVSRSATLLFGDGEGGFPGGWTKYPDMAPLRLNGEGGVIAIADLAGDSDPDILVTSGDSDELFVFRNPRGELGDEPFGVEIVPVGAFPFGVVAADLHPGVGLEVAVSHGESDDVWIYPGTTGAPLVEPAVYPSGGVEPGFVRAADLNGDGRLDLVATNHSSAQVTVLLNQGLSFAAAVTYDVGEGPSSPAPFDLDGDGDLDLMTSDEVSGTLSVLWNDSGVFTPGDSYATGGVPFYVQPLDFDGDGDLDVAVPMEGRGVVVFWENDGSGGLTEVAETIVGAAPGSIAAGDVDGDGDVDLIVTNYLGDTISILLSRRG